jgi:cytochrome c-type biogenesis protein CcsB
VTDATWEALSNQAVAAAGVVYFLAMIAHLVEVSAGRRVPAAAATAQADPAAEGSVALALDTGGEPAARRRREAMFGRLGVLLTVIAAGTHLLSLVARGMAADPNRVPWGNMYEFTLSGTFVVAAIYLVLLRRYGLAWMAPIVVGVVLTLLMVAVIWLYAPIAPLTEALYSPWLVIHVVSAVIATAAFTLGGIASVLYLLKSRPGARDRGYLARVPAPADLDRLSYRMHAFGFPVWTFAVLITGPIWAHEAWSTYWNWDPKEVWAFITWVVYAAYLHARATAGWRGRNAALLALLGLATLWFNFIGINFFSTTSQHSYADASAVVVTEPAQEVGVVVGAEGSLLGAPAARGDAAPLDDAHHEIDRHRDQ